jgi:hypothetical protein
MAVKNSLLGYDVSFDKHSYNEALKRQEILCGKINDVFAEYKYLFPHEHPTAELLKDLIKNRTKNIRVKMFAEIDNSPMAKGLPISVIEGWKEAAKNGLAKLEAKLQEAISYQQNTSSGLMGGWGAYQIFLDAVTVVDSTAVISEEGRQKIKAEYTITIETDRQARFYELYLQAKKHVDAFADYCHNDLGLNFVVIDEGPSAISSLDSSDHMTLDCIIFKNFR